MQSFDQLWQIAKDQHARNLREAEQQRLAKMAEESNPSGPGLAHRLLWRIGDGLVSVGVRLTAGRPSVDWQMSANQQGQ
jgi:hypothetical protein